MANNIEFINEGSNILDDSLIYTGDLRDVELMWGEPEKIKEMLKKMSSYIKILEDQKLETGKYSYITIELLLRTVNKINNDLVNIIDNNSDLSIDTKNNIKKLSEEISLFYTVSLQNIDLKFKDILHVLEKSNYSEISIKLFEKTIDRYQKGFNKISNSIYQRTDEQLILMLNIKEEIELLNSKWISTTRNITLEQIIDQHDMDGSSILKIVSLDQDKKSLNVSFKMKDSDEKLTDVKKVDGDIKDEIFLNDLIFNSEKNIYESGELYNWWNLKKEAILWINYYWATKWGKTYIMDYELNCSYAFDTPMSKDKTKIDEMNIKKFIKVLYILMYKVDKTNKNAEKTQTRSPIKISMSWLNDEQINLLASSINSTVVNNPNIKFTVNGLRYLGGIPLFDKWLKIEKVNISFGVGTTDSLVKLSTYTESSNNPKKPGKVITYLGTRNRKAVWINKILWDDDYNENISKISDWMWNNLKNFDKQLFFHSTTWAITWSIFDVIGFENVVAKYALWEYNWSTETSWYDKKNILNIGWNKINLSGFIDDLKTNNINKTINNTVTPYNKQDLLNNLSKIFGFDKITIDMITQESTIKNKFEILSWETPKEISKLVKDGSKRDFEQQKNIDKFKETTPIRNFYSVIRWESIYIIKKIAPKWWTEYYEDLSIEFDKNMFTQNELYEFVKNVEKVEKKRQSEAGWRQNNYIKTLDLSKFTKTEQLSELLLDYVSKKWVVIWTLKLPNIDLPANIENYISIENIAKAKELGIPIQIILPTISTSERYNMLEDLPVFPEGIIISGKTRFGEGLVKYCMFDYSVKNVDWVFEMKLLFWTKPAIDISKILWDDISRNKSISKIIYNFDELPWEFPDYCFVTKQKNVWERQENWSINYIKKQVLDYSIFDLEWFSLELMKYLISDKSPDNISLDYKKNKSILTIWNTKIDCTDFMLNFSYTKEDAEELQLDYDKINKNEVFETFVKILFEL